MAFIIEDGTGQGHKVEVTKQNRVKTQSVVTTKDQDVNERTGKVWSASFENLSPTATNDFIFYLQNTGDTDIEVSDFRLSSETAATQVVIIGVDGTPSGGTSITPVSRRVGSSATASVVCEQGSDITGLTANGLIFYMNLAVVDTLYRLSTSSKIIIPKGKAIGIYVEEATASVTGVVSFYEDV